MSCAVSPELGAEPIGHDSGSPAVWDWFLGGLTVLAGRRCGRDCRSADECCGERVPVAPVDLEDSDCDVLTDRELPGRSAVDDAALLSSDHLSEHGLYAGDPAGQAAALPGAGRCAGRWNRR